ncbi:MAG: hypothetical protein H0V17_16750, partial [Deltaproteobacteria bacterium]|nr:hypothetical protein [Deltaproteobacteria bacterium]
MRSAALLLFAVVVASGCKDKSETKPATSSSDDPESTVAGSPPPKLERERDRFGNIPGRVDDKQREARKQRLGKTLLRLDTNKDT